MKAVTSAITSSEPTTTIFASAPRGRPNFRRVRAYARVISCPLCKPARPLQLHEGLSSSCRSRTVHISRYLRQYPESFPVDKARSPENNVGPRTQPVPSLGPWSIGFCREGGDREYDRHYSKHVPDCVSQLASVCLAQHRRYIWPPCPFSLQGQCFPHGTGLVK